jgi:FG-GAP-like repeat
VFTVNGRPPHRILLVLAVLALQLTSTLTHATPQSIPQNGHNDQSHRNRELESANPVYLPQVLRPTDDASGLYPLLRGFPREVSGRISTPPIVSDLDHDGSNELLVATDQGTIYAWTAAGSGRPGFPLTAGGSIKAPLALGDLNSDGDLEIVAAITSIAPGIPGQVGIWQPDGTSFPGWPQSVDLFDLTNNSELRTVVLADITSDGALEVIAGSNNNILGTSAPPGTDVPNLYVWDHTGTLAAGTWPAQDGPAILGTVAAGDFDGDGRMDVVAGRDYQWLFAYDTLGNALPGWPIETLVPHNGGDQTVEPRIIHKRSIPTLVDLDGDGVVECIVAGTRKLPGSELNINTDLLVLEPDGTRRAGWETPASGTGFLGESVIMDQAPAIADLNGDGQLDIVVPTQDGWIRAYKADKTLLWQFQYAQGQMIWSSEPVIGDVDNDGHNEVVFGTYDPLNGTAAPVGLWILEDDGTVKAGMPLAVERPGIAAAPTLADLNGDGMLDIIAASRNGTIYAWNTGASFDSARLPWPVARLNLQRTAAIPNRTAAAPPRSTRESLQNPE